MRLIANGDDDSNEIRTYWFDRFKINVFFLKDLFANVLEETKTQFRTQLVNGKPQIYFDVFGLFFSF